MIEMIILRVEDEVLLLFELLEDEPPLLFELPLLSTVTLKIVNIER